MALGPDSEVVGFQTNSNGVARIRHAEVNLVHTLCAMQSEVRVPIDSVVVSLKPCKMCSALLESFLPAHCKVLYLEDDPGPLAQNTALEKEKTREHRIASREEADFWKRRAGEFLIRGF